MKLNSGNKSIKNLLSTVEQSYDDILFNNKTLCRTVPTCEAVQLDGGVKGSELLLEGVHGLDQPPELGLGSVGGLSLGDRDDIPGGFAGTVVILQSVSISTSTPSNIQLIIPFLTVS